MKRQALLLRVMPRSHKRKGPHLHTDAFEVADSADGIKIIPNHPDAKLADDVSAAMEVQWTLLDIFKAADYRQPSLPSVCFQGSIALFLAICALFAAYLHGNASFISSLVFPLLYTFLASLCSAIVCGIWLITSLFRKPQEASGGAIFRQRPIEAEIHGVNYLATHFTALQLRDALKRSRYERGFLALCTGALFALLAFIGNPAAAVLAEKIAHDLSLQHIVVYTVLPLIPSALGLLILLVVAVNTPVLRNYRSEYLLELAIARQDDQSSENVSA